jgi:hypothetical protein
MPSLPACRIVPANLAVVLQVIPIMDEVALLAEFSALADHTPDFALFTPASRVHQEWMGKLQALVRQWNPGEVPPLRGEVDYMGFSVVREKAVSNIVGVLYRAIADLQFRLQGAPARAFGPGAVYDFFRNLRDLLASATRSILIVDPYLDEQVFDTYLGAVPPKVVVRLLSNKGSAALKPAVEKFVAQSKMTVEARRSNAIHDRLFFLDDSSCWVLGQSIKDAATSKPTYLVPLDSDTMPLKKNWYEQIWTAATPI